MSQFLRHDREGILVRNTFIAMVASAAVTVIAPQAMAQEICGSMAHDAAATAEMRDLGRPLHIHDEISLASAASTPPNLKYMLRLVVRIKEYVYTHPTISPSEAYDLGYSECTRKVTGPLFEGMLAGALPSGPGGH